MKTDETKGTYDVEDSTENAMCNLLDLYSRTDERIMLIAETGKARKFIYNSIAPVRRFAHPCASLSNWTFDGCI